MWAYVCVYFKSCMMFCKSLNKMKNKKRCDRGGQLAFNKTQTSWEILIFNILSH